MPYKQKGRFGASAVMLVLLAACTMFVLPLMARAESPTGTDVPYIGFVNEPNDTPDLYVTKTVSSASEGYEIPDEDFYFTVKVDGEFYANEEYKVFDSAGEEVLKYEDVNGAQVQVPYTTDGNGGFTLKAGQTAMFPYVGSGKTYEVTEQLDDDSQFVQTLPSGGLPAVGTVEPVGSTAAFHNTYIPYREESETTVLQVSKTTSYLEGYAVPETPDFTFELTVGGTPYAEKVFDILDSEGNPAGTGTTDTDGRFTLKGGQTASFDEVPVNMDYEVKEILNAVVGGTSPEAQGWRQTGATGTFGATKAPLTYASFNNALASFAVSKRMDDYTNDDGATFTFVLTDETGAGMAGKSYYLYDGDKNLIGDAPLQTKTDGSFELAPGQTAVFVGIAPDTVYNVMERSQKGFVQTFPESGDGYTNKTVRSDAVETLPFINKLADKTGTLALSKTVRGGTTEDYEKLFKFTVKLDDETISDTFGDFTFENGVAEIELKNGETKYASGLPAGVHYTVEEDKASQKHFKVISENETGIVPEDNTITAAFVNEAISSILPYAGGPGSKALMIFNFVSLLTGFCLILSAKRRGAKAARQ